MHEYVRQGRTCKVSWMVASYPEPGLIKKALVRTCIHQRKSYPFARLRNNDPLKSKSLEKDNSLSYSVHWKDPSNKKTLLR